MFKSSGCNAAGIRKTIPPSEGRLAEVRSSYFAEQSEEQSFLLDKAGGLCNCRGAEKRASEGAEWWILEAWKLARLQGGLGSWRGSKAGLRQRREACKDVMQAELRRTKSDWLTG